MPNIILTDECAQAIRGAAENPFKQTGQKLADGNWSVPVDQEVFDRLRQNQLDGETLSDTILRAIAVYKGLIQ